MVSERSWAYIRIGTGALGLSEGVSWVAKDILSRAAMEEAMYRSLANVTPEKLYQAGRAFGKYYLAHNSATEYVLGLAFIAGSAVVLAHGIETLCNPKK